MADTPRSRPKRPAPLPLTPDQWEEWDRLTDAARWEIDRFHHVRDVFPGDLRKLKASVRRLRRLCRTLPDVHA